MLAIPFSFLRNENWFRFLVAVQVSYILLCRSTTEERKISQLTSQLVRRLRLPCNKVRSACNVIILGSSKRNNATERSVLLKDVGGKKTSETLQTYRNSVIFRLWGTWRRRETPTWWKYYHNLHNVM